FRSSRRSRRSRSRRSRSCRRSSPSARWSPSRGRGSCRSSSPTRTRCCSASPRSRARERGGAMNDLVLRLPTLAGEELLAFVLVAARVGGLFAFAPVFSSTLIPLRVRVVAAGALALAISPVASRQVGLPAGAGAIAAAIAKEILVGLALAFAVGIVLAAVHAGAALIDAVVGFSFAQIVDPFTSVQAAAFGQLYAMFATVVLLLTGGDRMMIAGLADSYRI